LLDEAERLILCQLVKEIIEGLVSINAEWRAENGKSGNQKIGRNRN